MKVAAKVEEHGRQEDGGLGALFEEPQHEDVIPHFGGCEDNGMGDDDDAQINSSSQIKCSKNKQQPGQSLTDSDMKKLAPSK